MEAAFCLAGGLLLMIVSVAKILREVLARAATRSAQGWVNYASSTAS